MSAVHYWNPGELDKMQACITDDGRFDEWCEACGRWISEHDANAEACSPSNRRYKGVRRPKPMDILLVIADERRRFVKLLRAGHTRRYSAYGWLLDLQANPAEKLRRADYFAAPVRVERAA